MVKKKMSKSEKKRRAIQRKQWRAILKEDADTTARELAKEVKPKPHAKVEVGAQVSVAFKGSKPFETDMTGEVVSLSPHLVLSIDYDDDTGEMIIPWTAISGVWVRVPDEEFEFKE